MSTDVPLLPLGSIGPWGAGKRGVKNSETITNRGKKVYPSPIQLSHVYGPMTMMMMLSLLFNLVLECQVPYSASESTLSYRAI